MKELNKVLEMQAHSRGVEEMRLSIDAKSLITIGQDGSIVCFAIEDKDHKRTKDVKYSKEILIEKSTQDELS